MLFKSTRSQEKAKYSSAEAIKMGLAPDGGLFVPESIPTISAEQISELCKDPYPVRAAKILSMYLSDYTYEELLEDCTNAYAESAFPGGAAQTVNIHDNLEALELWHGPTAAFKDMALQIMPRLLSRALKKTGETRTALILVATSGDTGKAALEGYRDVDGVKILVFYPDGGVSQVQKLQMATQLGKNVNVTAIHGNFDDAQNNVKKIFGDVGINKALDAKGFFLSSANSINWGRLVPQIVYYVSAYCDLLNQGKIKLGEAVNVCVPTGNFGNIFAAFLAKKMGLPVDRLICASNSNNVLTDFLHTGTYDRNRKFYLTMSPSMDILISSNLERLLYFIAGSEKTAAYQKSLSETGRYTVDPDVLEEIRKHFVGYYTDEEKTAETICSFYKDYQYLSDTHTAVAINSAVQYVSETGDDKEIVIASTASPYKFAGNVYHSIAGKKSASELKAQEDLSKFTKTEIPYPLSGLAQREVRFTEVVDCREMPEKVLAFAK